MRDAHHCPYLMQLLSLSFPRGPPSPCVGDWLLITPGPGRLPGPHPVPGRGAAGPSGAACPVTPMVGGPSTVGLQPQVQPVPPGPQDPWGQPALLAVATPMGGGRGGRPRVGSQGPAPH